MLDLTPALDPGAYHTCRLIAQTGYGQPADIARSGNAGFDMHLIKPVDPARLLAIVEQPALAAT